MTHHSSQSTLWTAYARDICEKANNSLFYTPLTMQLCMQRYGHKSYDVIRKSPNVDIHDDDRKTAEYDR